MIETFLGQQWKNWKKRKTIVETGGGEESKDDGGENNDGVVDEEQVAVSLEIIERNIARQREIANADTEDKEETPPISDDVI